MKAPRGISCASLCTLCSRWLRISAPAAILILLCITTHAVAEDYLFSVPRVEMNVTVLSGGGALLEYDMDFVNSPGGHVIDIVDVGMPNAEYSISEIQAWSDGVSVSDIRPSEYVKPGVEVHLGSNSIAAGASGNFRVRAVVEDLVFQDTTRKDYASLQITPTWFGSQYVTGTTNLTIRIHLPKGIQAEEAFFQDVPFTGKEVQDDQVVVSWQVDRSFTGPYRVGVSFPKRVMSHIVTMSISQLLMRWWRGTFSVNARIWIALAAVVAFGFVYFRFTGGTGGCFFVLLLIATVIFYGKYDATEVYIWPVLLVLGVVIETARRRRKSRYLPAIASVEGGGIKRGLTAPEAAVLLELPVNKVMTMILFGMMKKGLIRQVGRDPAKFDVEPNPPSDAVVQPYEKDVLGLLKSRAGEPVHGINFGPNVDKLIESVAAKMKGFDLDETREYYKHIISRAWLEAKEVGEIETWQKKMDEKIDWMMLDPNFHDRFRPYNDRYIPRSYRVSTPGPGVGIPLPIPSGKEGAPRFSDVAASVSGWFQNTTQGVVAKIEGKEGGIISLASVDKAMSKAMASSGGGRGGGGGGCACACAGCACACACAGGGR